MGLIKNILRSVIYMVLTFIFVGQLFKGLDILSLFVFKSFGSIKDSINVFLFWILFPFLCFIMFALLLILFKPLITFINGLITRICPYTNLGEWFISVNVLLSLMYYLYTVWWLNYDTSSFFGIIVCVVFTIMGVGMSKIITESTTGVFLER